MAIKLLAFYKKFFPTTAAIALIAAVLFWGDNLFGAESGAFNLKITTHLGDDQRFLEGDNVSFYVSLEKNAYLTIVYEDAGGGIHLLLPNDLYDSNFFQAGLFIPIPNQQAPFQFRITPPFGQETLWVFASEQTIPVLASQAGQAKTIGAVHRAFEQLCRSYKTRCEQASLSIETQAANP